MDFIGIWDTLVSGSGDAMNIVNDRSILSFFFEAYPVVFIRQVTSTPLFLDFDPHIQIFTS